MDGKNEIDSLKEQMHQVPFGMSQFQIEHMAGEHDETPARRRRHLLLQIDSKLKAIEEARFSRDRKQIDIDELEFKLGCYTYSKFEHRRFEIDMKEAKLSLDNQIKLIEDAMLEVAKLKQLVDAIPEVSREEFETQELGYWQKRLLKTANHEVKLLGTVKVDTAQALERVGVAVEKDQIGRIAFHGVIPEIGRASCRERVSIDV